MEPFRFVHAARLLLDHPLQGTGPLPDSIRPMVEDATLLAWEGVVEACLNEAVDLLLLTGDDSELFGPGLRGAAALQRGLKQLAEAGISVVIAGDAHPSPEEGFSGLHLPMGVVRLPPNGELPVKREGRILAVIESLGAESERPGEMPHAVPWLIRLPEEDTSPFCIRVHRHEREWRSADRHAETGIPGEASPAAYDATGGAMAARSIAIGSRTIHDPGPPQGIRPTECGPRGCMLVRVDERGEWEREFIPTAPVRYETIPLAATPTKTRDDLLLELLEALDEKQRSPADRVWLTRLEITGAGPCRDFLEDPTERASFATLVQAEHGIRGVAVQVSSIRFDPLSSPLGAISADDDLLRAFERRLTDRTGSPHWTVARCLEESRLQGGPWTSPLRALLDELDTAEVVESARRLGTQWLAAEEELSS